MRSLPATFQTAALLSACLAANLSSASDDLVDACEQQHWSRVAELVSTAKSLDEHQPDGMTALHWAVYHGHSETVRQLLNAGAAVDENNEYGVTPLAIACETGDYKCVELLIAAKADVKHELAGGHTMLMSAARTGSAEIVQALLDAGVEVNTRERRGQTALMWAAAEGHVAVIDTLIAAKADVNVASKVGFTAIMFAAREGRLAAAERLIDAGVDVNEELDLKSGGERMPRKRMTALMLAVESGHFELALMLVNRGADPNDQRSGYTPLHAISYTRKTKVGDNPEGDPPPRGSGSVTGLQFVRAIVAAGADVNAKLNRGNGGRAKLTYKGCTPFLLAARTADLALMKTLHDLGARPNETNVDGSTALMAAAGVGVTAVGEEPGSEPEVLEAVRYLVALGADVNAVDKNGQTAMHGAAYRNYPQVVALLGQLGADPAVWNTRNHHNATPIDVASGKRPGSLKPSPETIAALKAQLAAAE